MSVTPLESLAGFRVTEQEEEEQEGSCLGCLRVGGEVLLFSVLLRPFPEEQPVRGQKGVAPEPGVARVVASVVRAPVRHQGGA